MLSLSHLLGNSKDFEYLVLAAIAFVALGHRSRHRRQWPGEQKATKRPWVTGGTSAGENALAAFVQSQGVRVVRGDRRVIAPREIDILIPSKSIGIEFNGNFWHSDEMIARNHGQSARAYHAGKVSSAQKRGVNLYFVWESDWNSNRGEVCRAIKQLLTSGSVDPIITKLTC